MVPFCRGVRAPRTGVNANFSTSLAHVGAASALQVTTLGWVSSRPTGRPTGESGLGARGPALGAAWAAARRPFLQLASFERFFVVLLLFISRDTWCRHVLFRQPVAAFFHPSLLFLWKNQTHSGLLLQPILGLYGAFLC